MVLISGFATVAFFLVFLTDFLTVFGASDTFSTGGVISESPIKYSNFYTFHCGYKVFFLKKNQCILPVFFCGILCLSGFKSAADEPAIGSINVKGVTLNMRFDARKIYYHSVLKYFKDDCIIMCNRCIMLQYIDLVRDVSDR